MDLFWKRNRLDPNGSPSDLSAPALRFAEGLWDCAILFVICHELGHAARNIGVAESPLDNEELKADSLGLDLYMPTLRALHGSTPALRLGLQGVGVAIRATKSLELAGVRFSDVYPEPEIRLQYIVDRMRRILPSEQYFYEGATILAAQLNLMDEMDLFAFGRASEKPFWRRLSSVISVSQHLVTHHGQPKQWADVFVNETRGLSEQDRAHLISILGCYYGANRCQDSFFDEEIRVKIGSEIRKCVSELPDADRALFAQNFGGVQ